MESMEKKSNILKKKGCTTINLLTGDVDFRAYNEGGGTAQKNVVKFGEAKLYETEGEKQSSICAHLRIDRKAADPGAELCEQLSELMRKAKMEVPEGFRMSERTHYFENNDVLKVWRDGRKRKLFIQMAIDTEVNNNVIYMRKSLMHLTAGVSICLERNESKIFQKGGAAASPARKTSKR